MDEVKFIKMYQNIIEHDYYNNENMKKKLLKFGGRKKLSQLMFDDEEILAISFAMNTDDPAAVSILVSDDVLVITDCRLIYLQNRMFGTLSKEIPLNNILSFDWSGNNKLHIKSASFTLNMYVNDSGLNKVKRVLYSIFEDEDEDEVEVNNNFCYSCGAKLSSGMSFCPNCGAKIKDLSPQNSQSHTRDKKKDSAKEQGMTFKIGGNSIRFNEEQWFYINVRKPFEEKATQMRVKTLIALDKIFTDFDKLSSQEGVIFIAGIIDDYVTFGVEMLKIFSINDIDNDFLLKMATEKYQVGESCNALLKDIKKIKEIEQCIEDGGDPTKYEAIWNRLLDIDATDYAKLNYLKKLEYKYNYKGLLTGIYEEVCNIYLTVEDILVERKKMKRSFDNEALTEALSAYKNTVINYESDKIDEREAVRQLTLVIFTYPFNLWYFAYLYKISPRCKKDIETLCEALGISGEFDTWKEVFNRQPSYIPGFE